MKKLLCALLLLLHLSDKADAQTTFQKVFGGAAMDEGKSVRKTADGGYFIVGTTTSFGAGGRDILVIRTNNAGDTSWTRTFGGDVDNEYGFCGQQTSDGGYIISGVASSFNDAAGDIYLIKLNAAGDTSWTRTYGGIGYEWGSFVQQTSDGGYIVVGQTPAFGAGGFDVYLLKINAAGQISWTKTYGDFGLEIGFSVQQTSDGGYILAGQIDSYGAGSGDFLLIKTDAVGTAVWKKAYGTDNEEAAVTVRQTSDGGYVLGGSALGTTTQSQDMCLLKTNATGDLQWSKTYGGSFIDECYQVIQTSDGGYVLCGKSFSFSSDSDYDVYVVKTDNSGNPTWSKTFGSSGSGSANDTGYSIQQTDDGGYIIAGETYGFGVGLKNLYLIKTDASGNAGCNQAVPATISSAFAPTVSDAPIATNNGDAISYPATLINSGTTSTVICQNIPLPSALLWLKATSSSPNEVELSWQSNFSSNSDIYEVYRSVDSSAFELINFVSAQSSNTGLQNYALRDQIFRSGRYYYKVKQIDKDGSYHWSAIESVLKFFPTTIVLYPNPAHDFVMIQGLERTDNLQITDASGMVIFDFGIDNSGSFRLATNEWPTGLYFVRYSLGSTQVHEKLVVH